MYVVYVPHGNKDDLAKRLNPQIAMAFFYDQIQIPEDSDGGLKVENYLNGCSFDAGGRFGQLYGDA